MIRRLGGCLAGMMAIAAAAAAPAAQMSNANARVRVGHYHLNVTSLDEHRRFWVDMLGGTPARFGSQDVIRFGDVLLVLRVQKPTGGTRGTTFDHIGFAVPDVPALTRKLVAAGYRLTEGRAGQGVPDSGPSAVYGRFSYLLGPDDVKVELVTAADPKTAPPIAHHHVHYVNPQYVEMRDWYVRTLGATERTGPNTFTDFFAGADLPGIGYMLNFFRWEIGGTLAGTAGRAVDHVGYEVRNLEEFCRALEARGIRLTRPYGRDPDMNGIATAALVDPWGTVIELTEGLDRAL